MSAQLFEAIERGDIEGVRALLAAGADTNAIQSTGAGWRPLHAAIDAMEEGGPLTTVAALLEHGAAVDGWDAKHDATPLLMAVFRGQSDAARLLLDAGADVNVVGGEGDNPLRWAAQTGDVELARLLLERAATRDIDVGGGISGMNALGGAARGLDIAMVMLLLEFGARADALDFDGWTASRRADRPVEVDALARWHAIMRLLEATANKA